MSGVKKRCVNEAIFSLNLYSLIGSKVITRLSLKEAAARVHMVICSLSSHGFNSTLHHYFFFFLNSCGPYIYDLVRQISLDTNYRWPIWDFISFDDLERESNVP